MLKMLDLFSGIGGFSLAASWTGEIETVAFCEIEKYPQAVLRKNFPGVPIYDDVRELTAERLRADGIDTIDIITGGFPCQDLSNCGKQAGFEGERSSLYKELLRIAGTLRPKYLLFENVTGLLTGKQGRWFSTFLNDLAALRYDAEWHCIPASHVGAIHHRDRVWILAYPIEGVCEGCGVSYHKYVKEHQGWTSSPFNTYFGSIRVQHHGNSRTLRNNDGFRQGVDRIAALGNSIVPQVAYPILQAIVDIEGAK